MFFVKFHKDGTVSVANRVVGKYWAERSHKWFFQPVGGNAALGPYPTRREMRGLAREVHKRICAATHGHKLAD